MIGTDKNNLASIVPEQLYPLPTAMQILRLRRAAVRKLKERGLKIHYAGNNGYVMGSSIIAAITAEEKTPDQVSNEN